MNDKAILRAIGGIDDEIIVRAEPKAKPVQRRRPGKRTLFAAAIVALLAAISGIALAVSIGLDFGSFYNSLFRNPDVKEIIKFTDLDIEGNTVPSNAAVSSGIEITLLSAVVDRYQAYLTIQIKDSEGNRLSDSISVINEALSNGIHHIITGPVLYNDAESKATIALTVLYGYNIAEHGSAVFAIDTILVNAERTDHESEFLINGSWELSYTVEKSMQNRVLIAYPDNNPLFYELEVKCSPVMFSVRMTAHGVIIVDDQVVSNQVDGYDEMTDNEKTDIQVEFGRKYVDYFLSIDDPFLTLDDGSIIMLQIINITTDMYGGGFFCPTDYYDVESLRSLTFDGVEYFFNGNP